MVLGRILLRFPPIFHQLSLSLVSIKFLVWMLPYFVHPLNPSASFQAALMMTIINLAQNFVGSNNLNLLQPIGQFGTRLHGGKDSASPRYIFTMLRSAFPSSYCLKGLDFPAIRMKNLELYLHAQSSNDWSEIQVLDSIMETWLSEQRVWKWKQNQREKLGWDNKN